MQEAYSELDDSADLDPIDGLDALEEVDGADPRAGMNTDRASCGRAAALPAASAHSTSACISPAIGP
jgi:hypothetical protein